MNGKLSMCRQVKIKQIFSLSYSLQGRREGILREACYTTYSRSNEKTSKTKVKITSRILKPGEVLVVVQVERKLY